MKVSSRVRALWETERDLAQLVQTHVGSALSHRIPDMWHFHGRVKEEESFALKVETGRFAADSTDDMYAATIVVPTIAELETAEHLVQDTAPSR